MSTSETETNTVTGSENEDTGFEQFGLIPGVLKAIKDAGYETPSPIQKATIPYVLAGKDVVGQAHTGTGKTAAFALPLLSRINLKLLKPQVFVLTPTRELAIQVAESFQHYAAHLRQFHVVPIYGGQEYGGQIRQLRRGVHVVVGTPGRVMDHMRRGTLQLDALMCLVLDEADEMLRMGFIDDVEWILEQTPESRQTALFSATMPKQILRIAKKYLNDPKEVSIKMPTATAGTIRQRYWMVSGAHKLDALTRILEAESLDAVLIFVRTKVSTVELSEKLEARGYASSALNGDLPQARRERTISQLKSGKLDIIVATDVAARGLDVERISHVINYDIPYDTEAYVHRIGRTGRAGRTGEAILFASPRERRMLYEIERATKQKIALMSLPSTNVINNKRIANFKQKITDMLAQEDFEFYAELIEQYRQEHDVPALDIAAALAKLFQGKRPLLLKDDPKPARAPIASRASGYDSSVKKGSLRARKSPASQAPPSAGMARYRVEVGHIHGASARHLVGAISNEADLDSKHIGKIEVHENFSTVDLPEGMPRETFRLLKTVWVLGQQLNLSKPSATKKWLDLKKKDPANEKEIKKRGVGFKREAQES